MWDDICSNCRKILGSKDILIYVRLPKRSKGVVCKTTIRRFESDT